MKAGPRPYGGSANRELWHEIAEFITLERFDKNKPHTVDSLAKAMSQPKKEIESAINSLWADLTIHEDTVVKKSWVVFPNHYLSVSVK